jgi:hypothetical protein
MALAQLAFPVLVARGALARGGGRHYAGRETAPARVWVEFLRAARCITATPLQSFLFVQGEPIMRKMGERLGRPLQKLHATPAAPAMDNDGAQFAWSP